jgi:hypothetical protein
MRRNVYIPIHLFIYLYLQSPGGRFRLTAPRQLRIFEFLAFRQDWITGVGVEFTLHGVGRQGSGRSAGTACVEDAKQSFPSIRILHDRALWNQMA